jgi:hypothetical protein
MSKSRWNQRPVFPNDFFITAALKASEHRISWLAIPQYVLAFLRYSLRLSEGMSVDFEIL